MANGSAIFLFRMDHQLDDRIRLLCERLIALPEDGEEFQSVAQELRAALKQHTNHLRETLRSYPVSKEDRARDSIPDTNKKKYPAPASSKSEG